MLRWYVLGAATVILLGASWFSKAEAGPNEEQAVVIHFNYGSTDFQPVFDLQERLDKALAAAGAGEVDGNELATSGKDGYLYLYGPSADRVFEVALPILRTAPFMDHATVKKVYGKLGTNSRRVELEIAL
jgi:hypothetical protein